MRRDLSENQLIGGLSDALLQGRLEHISVAGNRLSGSFPSFARATSLVSVDLSGNGLSGVLPDTPTSYGVVRDLNISGNFFNGTVPTALLWSLTVANRSLVASGNQLTGVSADRPDDGGAAFGLRSLDLSYNLMSGGLPSALCGGSPFHSLVLSYQSLSGTIPGCLAAVSFSHLDLSNNFFVGSLPSAFANMSSVTFLSLAHNNLDGTLPLQFFSRLQAATTVDLSQNFQNGTLPFDVTTTSQLALFDVTGNCGLIWPAVPDCTTIACRPLCCMIPCSSGTRVCSLLPQLPATLCAYALPPAPLGVRASSLGSDGSLRVQWSAPPLVHARFCPLVRFIVQVAPPSSAAFNVSVGATEFEANVTRVPTGVAVTVRVAAVNCAGAGDWSYNTSAVAFSRPGPPLSVVASGLNSGAALQWDAPIFSGLKVTAFTLEATLLDGSKAPMLHRAPSTGDCHANATLTGLSLDAQYVFRVRAECLDPDPAYCPGEWSPSTGPVRTYVTPSLVDQLVAERVVVAGACGAALLYAALLLANRKWKGRDFTALFRLAAVGFHVGSSGLMGKKLLQTPGASVQQAVYFAALAVASAWSATRAASFVRRSLLAPTPPAPHALTFDAWCTKHRAWFSSLLLVSCFQLSSLGVLRSRVVGPVDGMFSAPMDPKLWSEMQFHATATSLLRAVSTLVIIVVTYPGQYFLLAVMAGLTSSIGTLGYSIVTLLVDAGVRAAGRHRAKQVPASDAQLPLLHASSEVGMEMLSDPARAAAAPTLRARSRGGGREQSDSAVAAMWSRVGAFDGGLASDLRAAIDNASAEAADRIRELESALALAGRPSARDVVVQ